MSLRGRALRTLGAPERRFTLREPPDWLWDAWGGGRTYAGTSATVDSSLGLIPVFASVTLLASAVAQCPLIVYREADGGRVDRARDAWQYTLLHDRPNDETPADRFYETILGHLALWGNFYAEKVKTTVNGRTVVGELWPIKPSKVNVTRDSALRKTYEVEGNARGFQSDTILHIPAFGYDGLKGLSPITQARQELGVALAFQEFIGRYIGGNAVPAGVVQLPEGQDLVDETRREAFRQNWQANYGSLTNAGRVAVLEDGATWQSIGIPLKDIEFLATSKFSVNQIARLFQVPPEMIGGDRDNSMTYSNVESQALNFVKFSLARWLKRIEDALNHDQDLFPTMPAGAATVYPEFLVEGLLRGDSAARSAFYASGIQNRWLLPSEARAKENLPPVDGIDEPPAPPTGAPPTR